MLSKLSVLRARLQAYNSRSQTASWGAVPCDADYQVSDHGHVRRVSKPDRLLKRAMVNGALCVTLNQKRRVVARLVAEVFRFEFRFESSMLIGYMDEDPTNVAAENLIWYFRRETKSERAKARRLYAGEGRPELVELVRLWVVDGHQFRDIVQHSGLAVNRVAAHLKGHTKMRTDADPEPSADYWAAREAQGLKDRVEANRRTREGREMIARVKAADQARKAHTREQRQIRTDLGLRD